MEATAINNAKFVSAISVNSIDDLIENTWRGEVTLPRHEAEKYFSEQNGRLFLEGIRFEAVREGEAFVFTRKNPAGKPAEKRKYIMPSNNHRKVRSLLRNALNFHESCNIMLTGPKGSGKTEFASEVCREMGYRMFQMNGSDNLTDDDFYGTISIDTREGKNGSIASITNFNPGLLYLAMIEGTKVDDEGNQVLDDEGHPIVVGNPGCFFLDEFATVPSEVLTGSLQSPLEIPRDSESGRYMNVPKIGRKIHSHPAFCFILSGNTLGNGNSNDKFNEYSAQTTVVDSSTKDRLGGCFKFDYSVEAEKYLMMSILKDEVSADRIAKLADDIRRLYEKGSIGFNMSTRTIVSLAKTAEAYRRDTEENYGDTVIEALKDVVFSKLEEDCDISSWAQEVRNIWNIDILSEMEKEK